MGIPARARAMALATPAGAAGVRVARAAGRGAAEDPTVIGCAAHVVGADLVSARRREETKARFRFSRGCARPGSSPTPNGRNHSEKHFRRTLPAGKGSPG